MPLTEEEMMDRAGSETWNKLKDVADFADAKNTGDSIANLVQQAARTVSGAGGAKIPGVKNMQRTLQSVGMPVRTTGVVDQPTVDAVNAIFQGWDDAPSALAGGNLTAGQIMSNLPLVQKYLRQAIGGAQQFGDATKDG